jgi:hypothetical protein
MSRTPGTIAQEVARIERLQAELDELEHGRPRPSAKERRALRRAIARGRRRVQRMLDDVAAAA